MRNFFALLMGFCFVLAGNVAIAAPSKSPETVRLKFVYQEPGMTGVMEFSGNSKTGYAMAINAVTEDGRGVCDGTFPMKLIATEDNLAVLRDHEFGIILILIPSGAIIPATPDGYCGINAIMHGKYVRNE